MRALIFVLGVIASLAIFVKQIVSGDWGSLLFVVVVATLIAGFDLVRAHRWKSEGS